MDTSNQLIYAMPHIPLNKDKKINPKRYATEQRILSTQLLVGIYKITLKVLINASYIWRNMSRLV